jgi:integrase
MKRLVTKYPGVIYREVDRLGGPGKERMYYIRFSHDGKKVEEKVGRQYADRMTEGKAARIRADRIEGRRMSRKEIREAEKTKTKRWTIDRLATAYFESLEHNPGKSRKALAVDRGRYENLIKHALSNREPRELQPLDIERFRRDLQKIKCCLKGKSTPTRTLAPATIRATLTLLKRIINYGGKAGLCLALPFRITMPKVTGVTIEDLDEDQVKRLLAAIEADPDKRAGNIMLIALFTGMRRGEIFKLKWEDLDFQRGFIHIRGPKGGKDETIPMNGKVRVVFESTPKIGEYVFPGKHGNKLVTIQRSLRRIRKAAGLPATFRPLHGLRHAFASRLASSGQVDMYTLQKLLTHKSPVMTQRYAHLRDESLRRASELAGALVDNVASGKGE